MTQSTALSILKLGKNVFLTGAPGAGKTYLLNQYISFLQSRDVHAAITAYTGIAASHLNGGTLHSWAGLSRSTSSGSSGSSGGSGGPMEPAQERERVRANKHLTARIQGAKVLIIDEISMLHPEEFDRVDLICRTARNSDEPFGGLQLICCGDFFQIPPVKQDKERFVIDAPAWQNADMQICYLTEQHRQKSDPENIEESGAQEDGGLLRILREIREGKVSAGAIKLLESRLGAEVDAPIGLARLYTHNENVDEINRAELRELKGDAMVYDVHANGNAKRIEKLQKDHKIDKLVLKVGARVMFTRNNMAEGYVNGTLGEVTGFDKDGDPVVTTFDGRAITAEREAWELEEEGKVVASVRQVPLRLAWAITVHKSQGMTLDAAEINLGRAFDKGMGYVALSRVRRLENISLIAFNAVSLEVSDRIKVLDKEFVLASGRTEAWLAGLSDAEREALQEGFIGAAPDFSLPPDPNALRLAWGEESEGGSEALDELPVVDFE